MTRKTGSSKKTPPGQRIPASAGGSAAQSNRKKRVDSETCGPEGAKKCYTGLCAVGVGASAYKNSF
jgi:hypothetical protein